MNLALISPSDMDSVIRQCLRINRDMARRAKREGDSTLRRLVIREALAFRQDLRTPRQP